MKHSEKTFEVFATRGDSEGIIDIQWDPVAGALGHVVQKSKNGNKPVWKHVDIIKESSYTIEGLRSNRTYLFRIEAIFPKGENSLSDQISKKI